MLFSVPENASNQPGWALFDLDQTLLPWDTQLLFCNWVLRKEPLRRLYLLLFVPFMPLAPLLGSERMKRIFLSFLWRIRRDRLEELVREFVAHYVPGEFYPEVLAEVEAERKRGRNLVLISASPEFYAVPIGEALGFDHSFGTRVEFKEVMPLFPQFKGGNNKSEVKVERLREEFGIDPDSVLENSAGYSDSMVDQPMLNLCKDVTTIHAQSDLQVLVEQNGWRSLRPPRPFEGRRAFAWRCLKQMLGAERI